MDTVEMVNALAYLDGKESIVPRDEQHRIIYENDYSLPKKLIYL